MRIVRLHIERFRSIRCATLLPERHNVYLGPNNIGKTAILEALNLLLNPEIGSRSDVVDENDFFRREYQLPSSAPGPNPEVRADSLAPGVATEENPEVVSSGDSAEPVGEKDGSNNAAVADGIRTEGDTDERTEAVPPVIRVEAVITDLSEEDVTDFASVLVPWDAEKCIVVEGMEEGEDPFEKAEIAIRPCFEAWYDEDEDDFAWRAFFKTDPQLTRDESLSFTKRHRRRIGFLIYRDFRALQRPITLQPYALFSRLLQSQDATPKDFEGVLDELEGSILPLFNEPNFARVGLPTVSWALLAYDWTSHGLVGTSGL